MEVKQFVHKLWIMDGKLTTRNLDFETILNDASKTKQPIQMQLKNKNVIVGVPDQVADGVAMFIGEHDDIVFVNMDQIEMVRFYNPELDMAIMEEQKKLQEQPPPSATDFRGNPAPQRTHSPLSPPLEVLEELENNDNDLS